MPETTHQIIHGERLEAMRSMPGKSVDLVLCSPPYESARAYGELGFSLDGQDWVNWAVERFVECVRVSRGLVAWVVEGRTRQFRWSATPALLMADLHRAGIKLRKPPAYFRVGIPGSGGPDWWRNDYEFIVCASHGKLPWSDPTACGNAPKYGPGGAPSHRTTATRGSRSGDTRVERAVYKPPAKANPGNVIRCHGGGGHMGSKLAHENEAPFSEALAERFVLSFCPPEGTVLDCFGGSGTTMAVAAKNGRNSISIDIRASQAALMLRRLQEVKPC